jgi:hypothetical protein
MVDFAILAPVPMEHLQSGLEVQHTQAYVAYGSMKWQLFREVDKLRNGQPVPMLIYPSHDADRPELTYEIGWIGWYIGHAEDYSEKHADETNGRRPPSTEKYLGDNAEGWAVFWRVEKLRPLPESMRVSIGELESYKTGHWRKNAAPYGPKIVAKPDWFNDAIIHGHNK